MRHGMEKTTVADDAYGRPSVYDDLPAAETAKSVSLIDDRVSRSVAGAVRSRASGFLNGSARAPHYLVELDRLFFDLAHPLFGSPGARDNPAFCASSTNTNALAPSREMFKSVMIDSFIRVPPARRIFSALIYLIFPSGHDLEQIDREHVVTCTALCR
jgi:hypothetical protein